MTRTSSIRDRFALALLVLVLAVRVLVPAGWMPAATGQGFAITVCSGAGMESAWVDAEGKIHKQKPVAGSDQQCAFAGLGMPVLGGDVPLIGAPAPQVAEARLPAAMASIGQGLAAPPPPATGPPAHI